ncbi:hypothetical protein [Mesorhizobium sp. CN2-181]|uniref:hypothetical protein n=1 Tax=Mesorhizobium yinganensis TaxID=3157707 RepID=UPI0032B7F044
MSEDAGFVRGLDNKGYSVDGKSVYMAGAGGAGASIAVSLLDAGVNKIAIYDPKHDASTNLINILGEHYPGRVVEGPHPVAEYDLIVNATSLGPRPGDPILLICLT